MPLKVSSQGWVKVPAPKKPPRPRYVDPEEEKEALCSPLRYFACQGLDPSRERLRMLGERGGFSSSQENLYRPHSRLERSSTLDEWRFDTQPARSSSRQSGSGFESPSPPRRHSDNQRNSDGDSRSRMHASGNFHASHNERRERVSSAPVIKTISPPASVYEDADSRAEEIIEVEPYPDNASVAHSETPSERICRHKHRHSKTRKPPTTICEEEEEPDIHSGPSLAPSSVSSCSHTGSETPVVTNPAPPPSIAPSGIKQTHKPDINIPSPIPEEPSVRGPVSAPSRARSEKSEGSSRSSKSSGSSRSSRSSRSDNYQSRDDDSESSYSASTLSASPIREHRRRDYQDYDKHYYPSPPSSPPPSSRRYRYEPEPNETSSRSYRDRVVTAPVSSSRLPPNRSGGSYHTRSSYSSGSRSSAPSMDGYQFQAAIFQPKNYQGYRAPSLSKGNRWETATSALSFD